MSIIAIRQSNRHRPAPIREGVAWRCKNTILRSPPRREIANIRFDTGCLCFLNDAIVRPNSLIFMSSGRAIIQIPIDRSLL